MARQTPQPLPRFQQFLRLTASQLHALAEGRADDRSAQADLLSLARVLERQGLREVSGLGAEAAAVWARRIGIS